MDLDFYVRVRTCEKRVIGKQPLGDIWENSECAGLQVGMIDIFHQLYNIFF